jgi:hypothetical protein
VLLVTHLDKQSQKIAKSKSKNGKIKKVKRTASSNKKIDLHRERGLHWK